MADRITLGGESFELHPSGPRGWSPEEANAFFRRLAGAVNNGELLTLAPSASPAANAVLIRANASRLEVSENGGDWRTVLPSDNVFDARDFGVVGDGATSDVAKLQDCLDNLSQNRTTGVGGATGRVYIPRGTYALDAALELASNSAYAIKLHGDFAGAGPNGTVFKATGSAGMSMLHCQGITNSVIADIFFNLNMLADVGLHTEYFANGGNAGSHVNSLERLRFGDFRSGAVGILVGNDTSLTGGNTYQASELLVSECSAANDYALEQGTFFKTVCAGNTKNMRIVGGSVLGLRRAIDWSEADGVLLVDGVQMAAITETCILLGGSALANIRGVQVENNPSPPSRFISGSNGNGTGVAFVQDCEWYGVPPADDYCIDFDSSLVLIGNKFRNEDGVRLSKVRARRVFSLMNYYKNSPEGGFAPLYDGSDNNMLGMDSVNSYAQVAAQTAISLLDMGGDANGANYTLHNSFGSAVHMNVAQMLTPHSSATIVRGGAVSGGQTALEFAFGDFSAAATSKVIQALQIPANTVVHAVYVRIDEGLVGVTTPTVKVGYTSGGNQILLANSAAAAAVWGKDAATEHGTEFWDGSTVYKKNLNGVFVSAQQAVFISVNSVSGNLSNLSAGRLTLIIEATRL